MRRPLPGTALFYIGFGIMILSVPGAVIGAPVGLVLLNFGAVIGFFGLRQTGAYLQERMDEIRRAQEPRLDRELIRRVGQQRRRDPLEYPDG